MAGRDAQREREPGDLWWDEACPFHRGAVGEHAARGRVGDDPAAIEHEQAVRDVGDQAHVVRDAHDRRSPGGEIADQSAHHRGRPAVLAGRRLVEDQDGRAHRDDRRDGDELPRPPLEVVRMPVEDALQAQSRGDVRDTRRNFALGDAQVSRPEGQLGGDGRGEQLVARVLERVGGMRGHAPHRVACGVEPVDDHRARRRPQQPVQEAGKRRLARPVPARDPDDLATSHVDVKSVEDERRVAAVAERDAPQLDDRDSARPSPRRLEPGRRLVAR